MSTKDVDKELADHVADKVADKGSVAASEALMDLHLETQAVGSNRVSLSPNSNIHSNEDVDVLASGDEEEEESPPSDEGEELEESDEESDPEDSDEDVEDVPEEADEEESEAGPIGWMSAQLKILEDEANELKKERRKIKGQNTRLRQALAQRKAQYNESVKEVKILKKENETLAKQLSDINVDTSVNAEVSKLTNKDVKAKLNEALKEKRTLEGKISKLETDLRKKDDLLSKYKMRNNELDAELVPLRSYGE